MKHTLYNILNALSASLIAPLRGALGGLALTLTFTSVLTSCSDFLDEYSQDMIVAKTPTDLDEVLLGSGYLGSVAISNGPVGTRVGGFFNLLDDDINTGGDRTDSLGNGSKDVSKAWNQCVLGQYGYFAWQQDVGTNYDASISNDDAATWDELYAHINVVNIILDEIQHLPHTTEKDHATWLRVQGECHFLRAQFYFTLVNLYGKPYTPQSARQSLGVPIKLVPGIEHEFTRATVAEVYEQINADLALAEDFLTQSPQSTDHLLHRASLEAVDLLWSRVLLYQQQWQKAADKALKVVGSKQFVLAGLSSFQKNVPFLTESNQEVIFSQGSNNLAPTSVFTARNGDYCVTRELYEMYDSLDVRPACFFGTYAEGSGIENDSIYLASKYQRGNALRSHISDYYMLRLSEAYLNAAEALALVGLTTGNAAAEEQATALLHELKQNRIAQFTPAEEPLKGAVLVQEIRNERRRELCFEGHRWFDLRRYGACEPCKMQKPIVHNFGVCGDYVGVMYRRTIILPPGSPNYTFAIPKSVLQFFTEHPMETNPREQIEHEGEEESKNE